MNQIELNVSEVTGRAWELSKKQGLIIAVVLLVASLISQSLSTLGFPWGPYFEAITENDPEAMQDVLSSMNSLNALGLISSIVTIAITAGILGIVMKMTKGSMTQFDLSGFKMPVMTYVNYILASIAVSIIVFIGTCFCIIPGIFLGVRLLFVGCHILEHPEDGFTGAFEKSWNMTKGNFWNLFLLGLLAVLICVAGFLCCCVGIYFAEAMIYFMLAVAYFTLYSNDTPDYGNNVTETNEISSESSSYTKTY